MKRMKPTAAELDILRVLWDHGPSTVRFVNDILSEKKEVGYTTTLKIMQIMLEKGLLSREAVERKHIYTAAISEKEAQSIMLERILGAAFGGSASQLVMSALGNHKTSKEELKKIRKLIDQLENGSHGTDA